MAALLAIVFFVAAACAVWAWLGDDRQHLRRCSTCWYDMSTTTGLQCPECGRTAKTEAQLHRRRPRLRMLVAALACMLLIATWGLLRLPAGGWADLVPRPMLHALLSIAAPDPAPPTAPSVLPAPKAAYRSSNSRWERLVWHEQVDRSLRVWADAALANNGPIDDAEFATLVPLAMEAHALYQTTATTRWADAWAGDSTQEHLARTRADPNAGPDRRSRAEWALAQLQYDGTATSTSRHFAQVPDELVLRALRSGNAVIRKFGVHAYGKRAFSVVNDRTLQMPQGWTELKAIAASDPDPGVKKAANDVKDYMDVFLPQP